MTANPVLTDLDADTRTLALLTVAVREVIAHGAPELLDVARRMQRDPEFDAQITHAWNALPAENRDAILQGITPVCQATINSLTSGIANITRTSQ